MSSPAVLAKAGTHLVAAPASQAMRTPHRPQMVRASSQWVPAFRRDSNGMAGWHDFVTGSPRWQGCLRPCDERRFDYTFFRGNDDQSGSETAPTLMTRAQAVVIPL